MRIVYITRGPFGLMGSNASYMFPSIMSKRAEVTVLAPKAGPKDYIVFEDPDVNVIEISSGKVFGRAQECAALIEEIDPDIVHVFGHPRCFVYPMMSRRIERRKRKWLLDIRTHIFGLGGLHLKLEKMVNTYLQRYYDHICHTAESSMYTVIYALRKPVSWVPIGINLGAFDLPKPRPPKGPVFRFVFVGSIARARRLDVLVENFGRFALNASASVKLEIYGTGNAVGELQQIIETNGFGEHIELKGLVPLSEVGDILAKSDAGFVHLPKDKFNDAPALKRIEYAAAGVRIIESDTAYHKLNPETFKTVLVPDEAERFGKILEEFIQTPYDFDDVIQNRQKSERFDWSYILENDLLPIYDTFMDAMPERQSYNDEDEDAINEEDVFVSS